MHESEKWKWSRLLQCMKVKNESEVAQSCPTLCNPMDCSPLGSSIHGVFQARVLDWGAIAFSSILYIVIALCSSPRAYWTPSYTRGSSSSVIIFAFSYWSWDSGGKNTGVVCRCLFKWFTFCQDSPWWPFRLGWPCTVWLIAALIYASPFTRTRLWPIKGTELEGDPFLCRVWSRIFMYHFSCTLSQSLVNWSHVAGKYTGACGL